MRKILLLFLFFTYFGSVYSQKAEIIYWSRVPSDTTQIMSLPPKIQEIIKDNVRGEYYKLIIQEGVSLYHPTSNIDNEFSETEKSDNEGNKKITKTIINKTSETIYTDKIGNFRQSTISMFGKEYFIKETLTNTQFEILDQSKMIGDLKCQLAITELYGKPIEVWFATSIPLDYGPSIFHSLPGLIVEVKMGKKLITATKIQFETSSPVKAPVNGTEITREDYDSMIIKKMQELEGRASQTGSGKVKRMVRKF